jgi:Mg-chelatase subunit ChlD
VSDGKTKVPASNPSSRKTKPPLRALNEESQQSRACGARYFVVRFFAHELLANGLTKKLAKQFRNFKMSEIMFLAKKRIPLVLGEHTSY